jgi:hypothetical protein
MCTVCQDTYKRLTHIDLKCCPNITEITGLDTATLLIANGCPNLTKISGNSLLTYIYADDCPKLCSIGTDMPSLRHLSIKKCDSMITVPKITSLKHIDCEQCNNLTTIDFIEKMVFMNFANCPKLINVEPFHKFSKRLNYYRDDHCPWAKYKLRVTLALPLIIWMQSRRKRVYRRRRKLVMMTTLFKMPTVLIDVMLDYDISDSNKKKLLEILESDEEEEEYIEDEYFPTLGELVMGLDYDDD